MSLSEQLPLGLATETEGYWDSSDWWDYSDRSEWRSSSMRQGGDFLGTAARARYAARSRIDETKKKKKIGATNFGRHAEPIQ